jgi:hypothetical protein
VAAILVVVVFVVVVWTSGPMKIDPLELRSEDNLRSLYVLLQLYAQNYGSYPTLQPGATRYAHSGGVRDLYPLCTSGIMKAEQLELLRPSGAKLIPFSFDPSVDEFDRRHIGYAYNSTAYPDPFKPLPLLSEQGVSDGILDAETNDAGVRAVFPDSVRVLFSSGKIEWIPADRHGRLSTSVVTSVQWSLLRD